MSHLFFISHQANDTKRIHKDCIIELLEKTSFKVVTVKDFFNCFGMNNFTILIQFNYNMF